MGLGGQIGISADKPGVSRWHRLVLAITSAFDEGSQQTVTSQYQLQFTLVHPLSE